MKYLIITTLVIMNATSCLEMAVDKQTLLAKDYRLFQETPVWDLAKATADNNLNKMEALVKKDNLAVDYRELRFGQTLLFLTIWNEKPEACDKLLSLGANPNIQQSYDHQTPLILSAGISDDEKSVAFIKSLLKYGADPNVVQIDSSQLAEYPKSKPINSTALITACSDVLATKKPLPKVILLVQSGANINYVGNYNISALRTALYFENYDVAHYLIEKGVDINSFCPVGEKCDSIGAKNVLEFLRGKLLDLSSKEYVYKMKIISTLKSRGFDYWNQPIPPDIIEQINSRYPKNIEEYLEKY